MLVPGVLFGMLAGYTYRFPKVFGFRLEDCWGNVAAWSWILGFMLVFFPLYAVGLMGMTRRTYDYSAAAFQPYMIVSAGGAAMVLFAFAALVIQLVRSVRRRSALADPTGDPWDGRSLEWSIPSPPPAWNFAVLPDVQERDDFTRQKESGAAWSPAAHYEDVQLPRNNAAAVIVFITGTLLGFVLVWHIWWLAAAMLTAMIALVIWIGFRGDATETVPAEVIARVDGAFLARKRAALGNSAALAGSAADHVGGVRA